MGRKSNHTKEEKIEIVRRYDNGEGSCEEKIEKSQT